MSEIFNIYCDESCHLENDHQPVMLQGAIWCPQQEVPRLSKAVQDMKLRHNKKAGERLPDLRQCERLPQVRPMLDRRCKPEILTWDHLEGDGTIKTYVQLENYDFVVVLKKYEDGGRRLITSFCVEYEDTKSKLRKKYTRRITAQK